MLYAFPHPRDWGDLVYGRWPIKGALYDRRIPIHRDWFPGPVARTRRVSALNHGPSGFPLLRPVAWVRCTLCIPVDLGAIVFLGRWPGAVHPRPPRSWGPTFADPF